MRHAARLCRPPAAMTPRAARGCARAVTGSAAHRQPPGAAGRWLHRLAGLRARWPPLCAARWLRRGGLPGGGRGRGQPSPSTTRASPPTRAEGGQPARSRDCIRRAERALRVLAVHRHQRQDLDRLVAGAGADAARAGAAALVGTLGGCAAACGGGDGGLQFTGLTTPDPVRCRRLARLRRRRACGLRDRGLVDRHRGAAPGRHADRGGGVHQLHPGPPGLPRQHGGLLGGQGACSPGPACAPRWSISTTPQGAELAGSCAGGALDLWTCSHAAAGARCARRTCATTDGGLGFTCARAASVLPLRSPLIGDYNVANLLGVIGGAARAGCAAGRCGAGLRAAARRCPGACSGCARGAGAAAGGGRLRAHARRAGQGAAGPAPAGARRAAAGCGACSAAAATATRPSAR